MNELLELHATVRALVDEKGELHFSAESTKEFLRFLEKTAEYLERDRLLLIRVKKMLEVQ